MSLTLSGSRSGRGAREDPAGLLRGGEASGCLEEEEDACKEAQVARICISFVPQRVFKGLYKVRLMPSLKKQECFCGEKRWVGKTSSLTQLKTNEGDEGIFHRIQTRP